jgi:hypothetical protein
MASKAKADAKTPVLKGQEGKFAHSRRLSSLSVEQAESKVLEYLKAVNICVHIRVSRNKSEPSLDEQAVWRRGRCCKPQRCST